MSFSHLQDRVNSLLEKQKCAVAKMDGLDKNLNDRRQKFIVLSSRIEQKREHIEKQENRIDEISRKRGEKKWDQIKASLTEMVEDNKMEFYLQQIENHYSHGDNKADHIVENNDNKENVTLDDNNETLIKHKDDLLHQLAPVVDEQNEIEERAARCKAECDILKKRNAAVLLRLRKNLQEAADIRRRVTNRYNEST